MSWLSAGTLLLRVAHEFLRRAERKEIGDNAVARESLKYTTRALLAIGARDRARNDSVGDDGLHKDDGHRID